MERNIVTDFSYGVYVVTANDGKNVGCIANCAMQITAQPATFAVSINHENRTHSAIKNSGKFAVSVLAQSSDPAIIRTFGFRSSKDINKFDGIGYEMKEGLPVLRDSCGFIVCEVIDTMETPTHTVFLGKLVADGVFSDREPMTYAYYHQVIKGSSPEKAPTYIPPEKRAAAAAKTESEKKTRKFVCSVCGYVYEGDELPEDFVCPVCGMGSDVFFEEE